MAENQEHFWLLFFIVSKKARMLHRCKKSYICVRKFRENNFNFRDVPHFEWPVEGDGNEILGLIQSNKYRTREIEKFLELTSQLVVSL